MIEVFATVIPTAREHAIFGDAEIKASLAPQLITYEQTVDEFYET